MVNVMSKVGITVEASHHEVATAGQCEIDMRFNEIITMADQVMWYKYIVRNVAYQHGKTATFMPKPLFGDNGSGMHVHCSLHEPDGRNLFTGKSHAGLSQMALQFTAGIIHHAPALLAFTNPTVNSYRRLVPGYEAPVNMAYSGRNRSAFIRIPISPDKARRIEFRTPDPTANPYLAFSAILLAGLDGIQQKMDPGLPFDRDIYSLSKEELAHIPHVPGSLEEAINALRKDHEFLRRGDVFSQDLIDTWIERKEWEFDQVRLRPTPMDFHLYYDY
jgi:glutamine synthetase